MDIEKVSRKFTYREFMEWTAQLVAEGKTSGPKQTPALAEFTKLNLQRMRRIEKTFAKGMPSAEIQESLRQGLAALKSPQRWVVITEAWCGDCAQNLPILHKLAEAARGKIGLNIILRDENPEWIAKYHTNGSRSVPKLVAFDDQGKVLFTWGPRPAPAQKIMMDWKGNPNGRSWEDIETELHTWYTQDKGKTLQEEFTVIFTSPGGNG